MPSDAIPLVFAPRAEAGPNDALLLEGRGADAPGIAFFTIAGAGHPVNCACCPARNEAGQALTRLYLARARGECGFFRRVVVETRTEAGRAAVLGALAEDPVASAVFEQQ